MLALIRVIDGNVNMNIANQNSLGLKLKINKRFGCVTEFTVKSGCLKNEGPSPVKTGASSGWVPFVIIIKPLFFKSNGTMVGLTYWAK
jgi:hypothetical protein